MRRASTLVNPSTILTIHTSTGEITSVTSTNTQSNATESYVPGTTLAGTIGPGAMSWTATSGLAPNANYLVNVNVHETGHSFTHTLSFTTAGCFTRMITNPVPVNGETVGVAMPIVLQFDSPVTTAQQPAVIAHLTVTSNPPEAGAWRWMSSTELHWRPEVYWTPGTTVSLTANFRGLDFGGNVMGFAGWSESFTIGADHKTVINAVTDRMLVYSNGNMLWNFPVSVGKPGFPTLSGNLFVWGKQPVVLMQSCSTFGGAACIPGSTNYYVGEVYNDVAISSNGFYIHDASWDVYDHGVANVSHGCVEMNPADSLEFYNFSQTGDLVVIQNTPNPADFTNDEADWNIPFSQYPLSSTSS